VSDYAHILRSSDVRALSDDARKDDENVRFVAALPPAQQAEWLARFRWLRVADRLAENEMLEPEGRRFTVFRRAWAEVAAGGDAPVGDEHEDVWREMRAAWWTPAGDAREPIAIAGYRGYLQALGSYTRPGLVLRTLAEHDAMLEGISGNGVCVFPYLREAQREAAAAFGKLDQMLNNLRDLAEDASHGLCYLPRDVLARFGVTAGAVLDGSVIGNRSWEGMMCFWLDAHLPSIRREAASFLALPDLHPCLEAMRRSSIERHMHIESVFRACDFDYVSFQRAYWRNIEAARIPA
jgi:phytoene synthase